MKFKVVNLSQMKSWRSFYCDRCDDEQDRATFILELIVYLYGVYVYINVYVGKPF